MSQASKELHWLMKAPFIGALVFYGLGLSLLSLATQRWDLVYWFGLSLILLSIALSIWALLTDTRWLLIAVSTLELIPLLALIFQTSGSTDSREILQRRGVAWNEENFAGVLESHDLESTKLFMAGGMKIEEQDIWQVLSHFDQGIADVLGAHRILVEADACPTSGTPSLYRLANGDARKAEFLRQVCGSSENIKKLKDTIIQEKRELRELDEQNARSSETARNCVLNLRNYGYEKLQDEATHMDLLNSTTLGTPRLVLEAKLYIGYLMGGADRVNMDALVQQTCLEATAPRQGDTRALVEWSSALHILN